MALARRSVGRYEMLEQDAASHTFRHQTGETHETPQSRFTTEWEAEDEARKLARRHEAARAARTAAAAEAAAAQTAAQGLLLAEELRAKEGMAKLEGDRRLRRLAEEQAEATARQAALQRERAGLAAAADLARSRRLEEAAGQLAGLRGRGDGEEGEEAADEDVRDVWRALDALRKVRGAVFF